MVHVHKYNQSHMPHAGFYFRTIHSTPFYRKVADVRREVWKSGFQGLFYGSISGYTLHTTMKVIHNRLLSETTKSKIRSFLNVSKKHTIFSRNTAFLSFMAGGALGSFLLATTTGKNEVHELHDIFHINERKKDGTDLDLEREKLQKEEEEDEKVMTGDARRKRMLSRRKTMFNRLEKGRGLSDSHGGHWIEEDDNETLSMTQKQRGIRRRTMTKRLEEGRGLSDSHSGTWRS